MTPHVWKQLRSLAVLSLVALLIGTPPAAMASSDDKEPDLKVEFVSRDGMTVKFKATNVGADRSAATKATLEMARPGPSNPKEVPVKELRPNESVPLEYTMSFTTPCDGYVVKVQVPLKNDANPGDNELEWQICDFAAPAPPPPDLELTLLGLVSRSDRAVLFEVKNVGGQPAPGGVVRIRTITPAPENPTEVRFDSLEPGKIKDLTDTLAVPCDGHLVGAVIVQGGPGDTDDNNDAASGQVCKPRSIADAALGTLDEARQPLLARSDPTPEDLKPGFHSITRDVAVWRTVKVVQRTGNFYLCDDIGPPELGWVGFQRADFTDANNCQNNWVYQTALAFDLSDLREQSGNLAVGQVILTWEDHAKAKGDDYVIFADAPDFSCTSAIGKPTIDWREGNLDGLIPNDTYLEALRSSRWNITNLALDWLQDPGAEQRGVVLKGPDESLDAKDSSDECRSTVVKPHLEIDYTILH